MQGASALAQALRGNDVLKTLELGYNPIGPQGAKDFSDVIKYDVPKARACSLSTVLWSLLHCTVYGNLC